MVGAGVVVYLDELVVGAVGAAQAELGDDELAGGGRLRRGGEGQQPRQREREGERGQSPGAELPRASAREVVRGRGADGREKGTW